MTLSPPELASRVEAALLHRGIENAADIAWACAWLEACGYPGLKMLAEAIAGPAADLALNRDALGLDLHNVSCAFLAPAIMKDVKRNGRVFLRNVRHGLFLLPFTVRDNTGIGCPVDPSFALGGERLKNPYTEKLALAEAKGLEVDEEILQSLQE
jgi:hypothetical protein